MGIQQAMRIFCGNRNPVRFPGPRRELSFFEGCWDEHVANCRARSQPVATSVRIEAPINPSRSLVGLPGKRANFPNACSSSDPWGSPSKLNPEMGAESHMVVTYSCQKFYLLLKLPTCESHFQFLMSSRCCITSRKEAVQNNFSRTELKLDIQDEGSSMDISPPIHFRIEWAGSQGKSPLLGSRPV